ncbi:MAG TPA: hypothetical protein VF383_05800 [Candidatus Dormibacteraeota bacterium]
MKNKNNANPDLQSQYESLLDQVWRSEANWRLWDRVDAVVMLDSLRAKRDTARGEGAIDSERSLPESPAEDAA